MSEVKKIGNAYCFLNIEKANEFAELNKVVDGEIGLIGIMCGQKVLPQVHVYSKGKWVLPTSLDDIIIETCDVSHHFAALPDHPRNKDGDFRCPHCLSEGLDKALDDMVRMFDSMLDAILNDNLTMDNELIIRRCWDRARVAGLSVNPLIGRKKT